MAMRTARWATPAAGFACASLLAVGSQCSVGNVDLDGHACPCVDNAWTCVDGVCVREADPGDSQAADSSSGPDSTDASAGPDGSPADASSEATADAGSPDGSWCEGHAPDAFFCSDFDEAPISAFWFTDTTDPDASVVLDTVHWVSPMDSLLARAPAPIADGGVFTNYAYYEWDGNTATAIHFAYDLMVTPLASGEVSPGGPSLAYPNDAGNPTLRAVGVLVYPSKMLFQELIYTASGRTSGVQTDIPPLPSGWNRIVYDITLESDAGPATCTVTVAGNVVVPATPLSPGWRPGPPKIAVGITYAMGPLSAASVNIDDVTLDIK